MGTRFGSQRWLTRAVSIGAAFALLATAPGAQISHAAAPASSAQSDKILVGLITKIETNPFFYATPAVRVNGVASPITATTWK